MDMRAKDIIEQGDKLFSKRAPLLTLWQMIADNFYPQRADFTSVRNVGDDITSHLTTSYPLLAQRELGSVLSSMLRPTATDWFHVGVLRDDKVDHEGRE